MNTFDEWYTNKTKEVGQLTTPSIAAKRLGVTKQHLNRIIEMGRIHRHKFENKTFISENEVNTELERRKHSTKNKEVSEAEEYIDFVKNEGISKGKGLVAIIKGTLGAIYEGLGKNKEHKKLIQEEIIKQIKETGKANPFDAYKKVMEQVEQDSKKLTANNIKSKLNKTFIKETIKKSPINQNITEKTSETDTAKQPI